MFGILIPAQAAPFLKRDPVSKRHSSGGTLLARDSDKKSSEAFFNAKRLSPHHEFLAVPFLRRVSWPAGITSQMTFRTEKTSHIGRAGREKLDTAISDKAALKELKRKEQQDDQTTQKES